MSEQPPEFIGTDYSDSRGPVEWRQSIEEAAAEIDKIQQARESAGKPEPGDGDYDTSYDDATPQETIDRLTPDERERVERLTRRIKVVLDPLTRGKTVPDRFDEDNQEMNNLRRKERGAPEK